MDKDTHKYFEDLLDLFARPGWARLVEEAEGQINNLRDHLEDPSASESSTELLRGQILQLRRLLALETTVNHTYRELKEEDNASV